MEQHETYVEQESRLSKMTYVAAAHYNPDAMACAKRGTS